MTEENSKTKDDWCVPCSDDEIMSRYEIGLSPAELELMYDNIVASGGTLQLQWKNPGRTNPHEYADTSTSTDDFVKPEVQSKPEEGYLLNLNDTSFDSPLWSARKRFDKLRRQRAYELFNDKSVSILRQSKSKPVATKDSSVQKVKKQTRRKK